MNPRAVKSHVDADADVADAEQNSRVSTSACNTRPLHTSKNSIVDPDRPYNRGTFLH
jgi:hypothetical protein